ncbi:MAG TPA: PIN domain-containing protein [Streptosporangiaceae bacterium]
MELFTSVHLTGEQLAIPSLVVTEACYLIAREAGPKVEAEFVRSLAAGDFSLVEASPTDLARAAEFMDHYADLPLGVVDAVVIATAERLGVTEIATLDRRHFTVVRPRHVPALTLLPQ